MQRQLRLKIKILSATGYVTTVNFSTKAMQGYTNTNETPITTGLVTTVFTKLFCKVFWYW